MINQYMMQPFAEAYRAELLDAVDHTVTDEIVRRPISYRVGARLVSIGNQLMGAVPVDRKVAA